MEDFMAKDGKYHQCQASHFPIRLVSSFSNKVKIPNSFTSTLTGA
jgi:hypothetical protein